MNTSQVDIQKALTDIALIRRTLSQIDQDQSDPRLAGITLDANLLLQSIALGSALVLLVIELFSNNVISQALASSNTNDLQGYAIGIIGFILAGLLITLYFVLWRAALHNNESIQSYITRNFKYVKNLSLVSDLLMKFGTVSLLLLAGKGGWIAPVLMAFTGDYLLQGRLFTFPTRIAAALGTACLAAALAQYLSGNATLLFPLGAFVLIAGLSIAKLAMRHQQLKSVTQKAEIAL